jgi:hypothetical protein
MVSPKMRAVLAVTPLRVLSARQTRTLPVKLSRRLCSMSPRSALRWPVCLTLLAACAKDHPALVEAHVLQGPPPTSGATSGSAKPPERSAAGAAPTAETVAPPREVCKLISREEVSTATRARYGRGEASTSERYDGCTFRGALGDVTVTVYRSAAAFEADKKENAQVNDSRAEKLDEFGESAYAIVGAQLGFPTVVVGLREGGTPFTVFVAGPAGERPAQVKARAVAVARAVRPKL